MYECKFCFKSFKKEITFNNHSCEKKLRYENKDNDISINAFEFWKIWMSKVQKSKHLELNDFLQSRFYKTFYEFSDFVLKNYSHSYKEFFNYIVDNNVHIYKWKKTETWNNFIKQYTRNENHIDATTRTINFIWNWSQQHSIEPNTFFNKIGDTHLALLLNQGVISPWVVYGCESGLNKVLNMQQEQKTYIRNTMDSEYWFQRFKLRNNEFNIIKSLLAEEGL